MKKGKTSKLNVFDDAKCYYGTVDSKEMKSIYIVLQTWIQPSDDYDNWEKITGHIKRQIQHTLLEVLDFTFFEKKQIVDLDLRTSGIQKGKKSFLNLEITLFIHNKFVEFKSLILRNKIKMQNKNFSLPFFVFFSFVLLRGGASLIFRARAQGFII